MKLGKSATEILGESFREYFLIRTAVSEWHSYFKAGRVSVEDDKCSGRPSTRKTAENVDKIREIIHEDRRRTIHELADTAGVSYAVCQEILTQNLNTRRIAAKFVAPTLDKLSKAAARKRVLSYERRPKGTQILFLGS
jgi:hypothetical protein